MNTNKIVSVIIVAYRNLDLLEDCLESIYQFNDIGDRLEIIVVDNSETGEIPLYLKKHYPQVLAIENDNRGFGQGNNVGYKNSNGRYLLFLNPDTLLVEPIFEFAITQFEINLNLGLFGVQLIDRSGNLNKSFHYIDKYNIFHAQFIKLFNHISYFNYKKMYTSGADMFMRSDVFNKIGMFDESFFMYYEEPDIVKRLFLLGYITAYFPNKKIIHLEGGSSNPGTKMLEIKLRTQKIYCKKYGIDFTNEVRKELIGTKIKSFLLRPISKIRADDYQDQFISTKQLLDLLKNE